jgi:ribonuclease HI
MLIFVDGCGSGKGPAVAAAVIYDQGIRCTKIILEGEVTAPMAEYQAVVVGLDFAIDYVAEHSSTPSGYALEIVSDSKIVVEQLMGWWKIEAEHLQTFVVSEIVPKLQHFKSWKFVHIDGSLNPGDPICRLKDWTMATQKALKLANDYINQQADDVLNMHPNHNGLCIEKSMTINGRKVDLSFCPMCGKALT